MKQKVDFMVDLVTTEQISVGVAGPYPYPGRAATLFVLYKEYKDVVLPSMAALELLKI